jgi:hypothetical protein
MSYSPFSFCLFYSSFSGEHFPAFILSVVIFFPKKVGIFVNYVQYAVLWSRIRKEPKLLIWPQVLKIYIWS